MERMFGKVFGVRGAMREVRAPPGAGRGRGGPPPLGGYQMIFPPIQVSNSARATSSGGR